MRLRSILLFILLSAVQPWPAAAQQPGAISGTVTSALNGEAVPNAAVTVESTTFSRDTKTDANGKYVVSDVPPGMYHIVVRLNQFLPFRTELTVKAGAQTSDVQLTPELHFSEVTSVPLKARQTSSSHFRPPLCWVDRS